MSKIPIIIDTDPGIDDAVALALALHSNKLDVKLITTVAGNVSIEKVTKNTLQLLDFYGKSIPVAKGAEKPLFRNAIDASGVHGDSGMGVYTFHETDGKNLLEINAVEAMKEVLMKSEEKITLVPIGPLTNIALLLLIYPQVKNKIKEIVLMGGAIGRGNSGIYSEFNMDVDPEAAKIVFTSGIPITMATLDVGLKALIYPEDSEKIKEMHKIGDMFYTLFKTYRGGSFNTGLKMYDSCAIAYLLEPSMFTVQKLFVGIETKGEFTSGATIVDLRNKLGKEANATVTVDIDADMFKKWFMSEIYNCR
ncbi:ribonucleoside hydrolase RihC [Streptobacillus ratti]|uniref:ribonucleoside hydrolase RihC n=1 Tax=Streptobacillus ratti TaxID=1720557 RepID=UPI0009349A4C|nr:ribonucleoside hydrolase RihC [Streptobacillus ratti]